MLPPEKRIKSKSDLKEWLEYERKKYNPKHRFINYFLNISESYILFKHQVILRKTEYYKNTGKKIRFMLSFMRLLRIQNKYSLHIPPNCCGKGMKIMHLGPVLMNDKTTIGENTSIHICTSFVAGGTNSDAPTVGANCVIGVGAVVLGGITIANNVAVGANAVVNKDIIEENIAVAGVPAKKISNNGCIAWK